MEDKEFSAFDVKWPSKVAMRGFAAVPKCLITCAGDLGLKPQEALVLFNVIEKCWKFGDEAWFSIDYVARNIGRKNSATREIFKKLESKCFISIKRRFNTTSLYDIYPCEKILTKHLETCWHTAGKSAGGSQKTGSGDSQKTSDYIEAGLSRNNKVDPLYSQHVYENMTDATFDSFLDDVR